MSVDGGSAWAEGVDISKASAARMYDFLLGGSHNFAIDREAASRFIETMPTAPAIARANRAFLHRAVTFLLDQGIDQFLDVGAGIPTLGSVHELVQRTDPTAHVVYVDIDPVAVAHATNILRGDARAAATLGDLRHPDALLNNPVVTGTLDLRRPVGLLLVSLLHFVADADQPHRAVARLRDALAPGSFLVLSHAATGGFDPETMPEAEKIYKRTATGTGGVRSRDEIAGFFGELEMVEPGLVWLTQWRGETTEPALSPPHRAGFLAGVGRKPPA